MTRPAEEEPTSSAALETPAPGSESNGVEPPSIDEIRLRAYYGTWSGMVVMLTSSPTGWRRSPSSETEARDEEASSHDDDGATIRRCDGRIVGHWV